MGRGTVSAGRRVEVRAGSLRSALRELVARDHARVGIDVRMYSGMVSVDEVSRRGWVEGWCRQDREWKCELDHCDLRSEYSSRESMRASGSMCACTAAWSVRMSWVGVLAIQCSSRVSVDGSRDGVGRTESGSASWITAICAPRTRRARPCARRDRCAHVQRHGQRR